MPEEVKATDGMMQKFYYERIYILDVHDSYADFIAAHPTGEEGDAYAVGGDLYIWGVSRQSWLYVGPLTVPDFAALSEVEAMLDDVYGAGSGSSGGGGGGSAGDGSVATDSEADEMLDDVFGSASGGSAVDDSVITTDEEAQEMLDDVFEG